MSARDEILARVRSATSDVDTPVGARGPVPVIQEISRGPAATLELFAENVADYRADVLRARPADVGRTIVEALRAIDRRSVVVPTGLDPQWQRALGEAFEVLPESEAATSRVLDAVDAVVTGSAVGIATTGTIVLDHSDDQGRRELTLVPDTHVCVIRADQVVHDVPEAVSRLGAAPHQGQPLTWISGPSATSDIELQRVEGVHGPRTLIVVLVTATGHGSPAEPHEA
jgi:L-lactate dehydrogenase complex protein LldG